MINSAIGNSVRENGRDVLVTVAGASGHAVYGPYEPRDAGKFAARFLIEPVADLSTVDPATLCAAIEVVCEGGEKQLARKKIYASDFVNGAKSFLLQFAVRQRAVVEYRVWVSGELALRIEQYQQVVPCPAGADEEALMTLAAFPEGRAAELPFFADNRDYFRDLYERGCLVAVDGDAVILTISGISFSAKSRDDLNFVGELFFENVYNFHTDEPVCAIDVGMNIGLSSLTFAKKDEVREVHSFEPFASTYQRAITNIALNPGGGRKISSHNFGLSDRNWEGEISVSQTADSGAMSTIDVGTGIPVQIALRDAGEILEPIIASARDRGLDVIIKMDCEGSEYGIFESLQRRSLLPQVTAFMVEWHAMFHDRGKPDLTEPLQKAGFVIFDRSPPSGNGFFYAANVRLQGQRKRRSVRQLFGGAGRLFQL